MVATYTKWLAKPCILMVPSCSFFLYKITQIFRLVAVLETEAEMSGFQRASPTHSSLAVGQLFGLVAQQSSINSYISVGVPGVYNMLYLPCFSPVLASL